MIFEPSQDNISKAIKILKKASLLGLPTETVYGLAGDATQDMAVAKIFEIKNRPNFNPLIIHGFSAEAFIEHVLWNEKAQALAEAFWPGPLTLVLPRLLSSSISLLASGGLNTVALRVPNHPTALALLMKYKGLLAAPSANPSGLISPTQALHVDKAFPDLFILNGGDAAIGLESTIVDLTGPSPLLLRPGGITFEQIASIIGPLSIPIKDHIKAPGMMLSHYCPNLPLRLNVLKPYENEAYLTFGPTYFEGSHVLHLSTKGDLTEAAANLFKMLRRLDQMCFKGIAVAPIPFNGIGIAVNDRLTRAAAPRELL